MHGAIILAVYASVRMTGHWRGSTFLPVLFGAFCDGAGLGPELARLNPKEVLLSDVGEADFGTIVEDPSAAGTVLAMRRSTARTVKTPVSCLTAFHPWMDFAFTRAEVAASSAVVVEHLDITQKKTGCRRARASARKRQQCRIDASTRKSLS
jgi:DNA mismatch repair protein MutS